MQHSDTPLPQHGSKDCALPKTETHCYPCKGTSVMQQFDCLTSQPAMNDYTITKTETSCSCKSSKKWLFPFRKVIIASRLIMLPEKGEFQNKCKSNNGVHLQNYTSLPELIKQESPNTNKQACNWSNSSHIPQRPVTPPLGRSAKLNEFIESRLQSGDAKNLPSQKLGHFIPTMNEQDHTIYNEMQNRVNNLHANIDKFNTPMSHFKNDERYLMNALRTYKRDLVLQSERCPYRDPKILTNVGNTNWCNHAMYNSDQTPSYPHIDKVTLCSDVALVNDTCGVCNNLVPKMEEDGYKRQKVACNNSLLDLRGQNRKFPVPVGNGERSKVKSLLESAVEDNLRAIGEERNERDKLFSQIALLEQSVRGARNKYDLQGSDKRLNDIVREIRDAENYKRSLLEDILKKERNLDKMAKKQKDIEFELLGFQDV